nr:MAG: terminase large subunit [Caudoviricetes sp.]
MPVTMNSNRHLKEFIDLVESGRLRASKDVKALIRHVKKCFDTEDIYVDDEQLEHYLGLARYFPYSEVFPWQRFVIALHDCTYWRDTGMPRWPDLFCLIGRGAGKDGTIALESAALASPYNGIHNYDIDICANNEEQALRPVKDIVEAFNQEKHKKKLQGYFKWLTEIVTCKSTGSVIRGRTNNPGGKDGLRSGAVFFNEVHQYQDYKNINVFTTGLGKKKHPRRGYYTTQGDIREGVLDDLIDKSEGILFNGNPDNGFLPFICRLDSKDEVHDERNWEKANPSLPYLPDLMAEIRKEYRDWVDNPYILPAFVTKRMNIPDGDGTQVVTEWAYIEATNRALEKLEGLSCTCGIDYAMMNDLASVNLHFKIDNLRFDLSHSWLCLRSRHLKRLKIPYREWADKGQMTLVDDVQIPAYLLAEYIDRQMRLYNIVHLGIDNFRLQLLEGSLKEVGFDEMTKKNIKRIRPLDIVQVVPVISSCFLNKEFVWGDQPALRWATNNTKVVRYGRQSGKQNEDDIGNFVYAKIEPKARKNDPFMALVHSMIIENKIKPPPPKAVFKTITI